MNPSKLVPLAAAALLSLAAPALAHADTNSTIARFRVDPHGRLSGVILNDGTELVTPPDAARTLRRELSVGDSVQITAGPPNTQQLVDTTTGRVYGLGSTDVLARGGGPVGMAQPYPMFDNASSLATLRETGRVAQLLHTPNGDPSGFVLEDGTQVHIVPTVDGIMRDVHVGDQLSVEGRGTAAAEGRSLWATYIARGRLVLLDMSRGPIGAPELGL